MVRCQQRDSCATSIASQDLSLPPRCMGSLEIPTPWSLPSSGAEKNGVRSMWASVFGLLRSTATPGPGSFLWRQAGLSRLLHSPGPVPLVLCREERKSGLARRQSFLQQTFCLLRGTTLPGQFRQSSGRRVVLGLAHGQRAGQAVHDGTTAACQPAAAHGNWHRRNRHRQRPQLPHRGQRSDPWPTHLVWRRRSLRAKHGRLLYLARPRQIQQNSLGRHGHVEGVPQLHPQGRKCSASLDHLRQVSCAASFARSLDQVRKSEYARLTGPGRRFIKGQKYALLSRWRNLTLPGRRGLKLLFNANKRLHTAYLLKESFEQLWSYETPGWARRFFDNWRDSLKWQRLQPYEKFAALIDKHWDGIVAYCHADNKVALGFVEGLNNKIRVIQRRAYGFRDEEYLRLKILTCMLPKL